MAVRHIVMVAFCGVVMASSVAFASKNATVDVIKSPNDQRLYRAITLPNKLQVVLVSDPETEKSAASLSVGIGLLFDPMTQQGMAHYLEHMLFLGTDKYPGTSEYSEFMTKNGGSSNAYTWMDITNYMFNVKNGAYDEALDRFADFFKTPKLYPEYAEKEKKAVNAEWSMRREMDFFGQFKLKRQLMQNHPANRFLIGNLETLGDKEDSKLHTETVDFYNKYYSANIMKLAMLSSLSLDEMETLARKHFSSIKDKGIADPFVTQPMPAFGGQRVHYKPNKDVKQVRLDFTIKNNMDKFQYKPNYFVTYLIGSEMPGTPAFLLKKMGLISSLSGSSMPNMYGNYGNFQINISLTDEGMLKREFIVATIMQYIDMIRKRGVDKKYYKEIQISLKNQFRFLEKSDEFSYVSSLAQDMQDFPVQNIISASFDYRDFNKDEIEQTLVQLTPDNLLVWYISKGEKTDQEMHFYSGKYRLEPLSKDEVDSWAEKPELALTLPAVNQLLPENFELYTKASKEGDTPALAFDHGGIQIWNFPSHYYSTQPRGSMRVMINNPDALTNPAAEVMLSVWANMFNLQQSALSTEASVAGMNLGLFASNGLTLSVSGFTDKQGVLLESAFNKLVVDVTDENFKQAIDRYVRGIKNSEKQFAYYQVVGKFREIIASGNYDNKILIKQAESLTAAGFKKFMKRLLDNNLIRVFSFGNYSQNDIRNLAEKIEQMLPDDRRVTAYAKTAYWKPVPGKTLVYRGDIPVEDVALIDLYVHPEPGFAAKAAADILSGHYSRIAHNTLRTEEQLAYVVTARRSSIDEYIAFGLLIQTPVKNVKDMQARFDEFNVEYAKEVESLTQEVFEKLKASRLTTLREKPKNLSEEVTPFIMDWARERFDFDSMDKLIAATEKVTLNDVKDFFRKTVGNKDAARISIQLRGKKFADQPFATFENEQVIENLSDFHSKAKYQ